MSGNNNIHFRAEVTIEEGKKEEYKKLIQDMSRVVEANEPDTINYRFYLNKSETECIVWETYANSEAVLAHINGVASQTILPKVRSVSRISRLDVYGNPSEELQKALQVLVHRFTTYLQGSVDDSVAFFLELLFYEPKSSIHNIPRYSPFLDL